VEEMKEIEISHPFQGRKRRFLLKDKDEFGENSSPGEAF
jgi:hypothetical protein